MPRYIKADKEYLEPFFYEHLTDNGMIAAQNAIDEVPTADVQEVKHGKWIKDKTQKRDDGEIYDYCCSECCESAGKDDYGNHAILSAYCPHCGAKMDGKD